MHSHQCHGNCKNRWRLILTIYLVSCSVNRATKTSNKNRFLWMSLRNLTFNWRTRQMSPILLLILYMKTDTADKLLMIYCTLWKRLFVQKQTGDFTGLRQWKKYRETNPMTSPTKSQRSNRICQRQKWVERHGKGVKKEKKKKEWCHKHRGIRLLENVIEVVRCFKFMAGRVAAQARQSQGNEERD